MKTTSGSLYQAAKLYFGLHGGSATVKVKSEQNSPVGEDNEKILAFGPFKPEYPAVVFSSEKLRFATEESNPGYCLCQKEAEPLSPQLSRRRDQINLHYKHLSGEEPKLKMIIESIIKNHSNSTLTFTDENKANLNVITKREHSCFHVELQLNYNLQPQGFTKIITPKTMESTAPALNRAVHELYLFCDSLTKSSQLISYPTENKNNIIVTEVKTTFKDVFQKMRNNKPESNLIIMLISFLAISTLLMIATPTLILCLTRRGLVNLSRNGPSNIVQLSVLDRGNYPTMLYPDRT